MAMEKMHFSVLINASKQKVWHTMLDKETYTQWTKAFNETSTFEGNWEEGSEVHFVGSDADGKLSGMYSRIKENRPFEFLSIEHLGIINNGVVDTSSEAVKKWAPAFENYTFTEQSDGTLLEIDMDIDAEYKAIFEEMWPKALQILKTICEN